MVDSDETLNKLRTWFGGATVILAILAFLAPWSNRFAALAPWVNGATVVCGLLAFLADYLLGRLQAPRHLSELQRQELRRAVQSVTPAKNLVSITHPQGDQEAAAFGREIWHLFREVPEWPQISFAPTAYGTPDPPVGLSIFMPSDGDARVLGQALAEAMERSGLDAKLVDEASSAGNPLRIALGHKSV
jgi:hypothetical protein